MNDGERFVLTVEDADGPNDVFLAEDGSLVWRNTQDGEEQRSSVTTFADQLTPEDASALRPGEAATLLVSAALLRLLADENHALRAALSRLVLACREEGDPDGLLSALDHAAGLVGLPPQD